MSPHTGSGIITSAAARAASASLAMAGRRKSRPGQKRADA
ncbi:NPXTG-anchored protein [Phaeovulum sp.]